MMCFFYTHNSKLLPGLHIPKRAALKIAQTKKRSSELGVFSFWAIYS
jgi:hypothetical protein